MFNLNIIIYNIAHHNIAHHNIRKIERNFIMEKPKKARFFTKKM